MGCQVMSYKYILQQNGPVKILQKYPPNYQFIVLSNVIIQKGQSVFSFARVLSPSAWAIKPTKL